MIFVCDKCGLEMDFDEEETELIECWECDGTMFCQEENSTAIECFWCGKEIEDRIYDCIKVLNNKKYKPMHLKCSGDLLQGKEKYKKR
jgi:DNA-directed RNA polymerase subunit RPC12/RpoP